MGIPRSKIFGSQLGAFSAYTLAGPPDRMMPLGFISRTRSAVMLLRTIWQKTFCSRTRRAISWPYWEPKSKIRMRSVSGDSVMSFPGCFVFCYVVRPKFKEFLQDRFIIDFAIAAIALDINIAILHEFDLPILPRGMGDDHDGINT